MPTVSDNPPTAPEPIPSPAQAPPPEAESPSPPLTVSLPRSSVAFAWSDALWQAHGTADGLRAGGLLRSYRLLDILGALRWREVEVIPIDESLGSPESLRTFHQDDYLQAVHAMSQGRASPWATPAFGFTEEGAQPFAGMAEQAARYVASARSALQAILSGRATRALSLAGQQVHARPAQAQSGAIFNDVLLSLLDARDALPKVAFLNLDAEHPTVVQETFYQDAQVLTLSLHEDPRFLYPGTGFVREVGEGAGQGFNVNLPLPAGTGDEEYLWAFEQVMLPLLEQFSPTLIVLFGGGTAHRDEPLAHLALTTLGYQRLLERVCALVPQVLLLGGAGMELDAMARLAALGFATLAGRLSALPRHLPARYTKSWGGGTLHDEVLPRYRTTPLQEYVAQRVQETVGQAQQALFPLWGLPVPRATREFYEDTFVPFSVSSLAPRPVELPVLPEMVAEIPPPTPRERAGRTEEPAAGQGAQRKRSRGREKKGGPKEPVRTPQPPAAGSKRPTEGGASGTAEKKQRRRKRDGQGRRPNKASGGETK